LFGLEPDGRENRLPIRVTVLSEDDIAAAQILEVVGEGAQGPDDSVGVPAGLVLDSIALHRPLAQ